MLFFAKLGNNQFVVHVAVKEMINIRDEMDTIITQKYKKNQEMPEKKENGLNGNVEKFRNKKERGSRDTQQ